MILHHLIFGFNKAKGFFVFLLLIHAGSFSQNKQAAETPFSIYTDSTRLSFAKDKPFYLVSWKNKMPLSATVIRAIDERTAIIKISSQQELELMKENYLIAAANDLWKYSPALLKSINVKNADVEQSFIITANDIENFHSFLKTKPVAITILNINKHSKSFIIKCKTSFLKNSLIHLTEVVFVDKPGEPNPEIGIIGYSRDFNGINQLDYLIPEANGKNMVVGVKEQKMEEADLDLYKRVVPSTLAAAATSNHATVVSSIIGGAGNSFYNGRGIANGCRFYSSSFSNLFADDAATLNTNKVTVQNHSYGTIVQQFYGAEAVSYDLHTWQNKNFVHVFSAGNSGKLAATEGKYAGITNYANLTGNFKMAKNIISVAAIDNAGNIPAESSSGPAYDGRLTPQLTALGPNGTSDAAAVISGAVAVMQQVYADSNSQALPPASLIKAILYNTADDIYKTGIDYKTGYGLVNSYEAVRAIQQKKYDGSSLSQNQSWTKNITVPANAAQIKITLAWTDTVAQANNNKALINDLDIELTELYTGNIFRPWVLSAFANADSLAKPATRKRDSLNTAEQVSIQLPAAGNYQVKVTGTGISNPSIPFHITYNIDTLNTFTFTSPLHASDVNRDENPILNIKWKTFVADTNQTGNLSISYNNGASWVLLKQSHKIYTNQFQWPIKDTASSAVLKMETGFGTFFSKDFIISKVINTKVDFICADSFQLSWDKHVYANAYRIFALTDSPYLKPVITVADTFKTFTRSDYPYLVYAVEPVLNNNIPAARSIASDIELQGVYCFYKTFYYNQLDGNDVNLILELSAASFVDSVYFERVTQQGMLLQTYGGIQVISNPLLSQFVNNLSKGITYFRARIKLKNGAVVYTDIISLLTSGKQNIVFYPNPASKRVPLNYLLMQGIPADNRIQFFDVTGRMIRNFSSLPTNIDISGFPAGLVIYKLFTADNKPLETGKLIIAN
ncbi:MAG: S8 family peptidase [Ferruginibacter sp.]|nr:S8 family peptidase [Ferruginibacter sp.]